MSQALHQLSVAAQAQGLAEGRFSALELTEATLARVQAHAGLGAFLAVDEARARQQARQADAARAAGTAGPLAGIPIAHKDIFVTDFARTGLHSTAGSKMLAGYRSPFDATVVARLAAAGTVTIG